MREIKLKATKIKYDIIDPVIKLKETDRPLY